MPMYKGFATCLRLTEVVRRLTCFDTLREDKHLHQKEPRFSPLKGCLLSLKGCFSPLKGCFRVVFSREFSAKVAL